MTLRQLLYNTLAVCLLVSAAACGGGNSFRITGTIEGIGTQNLHVVYYGDGALKSMRTAVVDGKFMFDGKSRDWTVVYIFNSSRTLIGTVIARDGESVQAKFAPSNTALTELKGAKPDELLARWMRDNAQAIDADSAQAVNRAVETFVAQHPDNVASAAVLTSFYRYILNPARADSLYRLIDPRYRLPQLTEGWADRLAAAQDTALLRLAPHIELIDINDSLQTIDTRAGKLILYSPDDDRNRLTDTLLSQTARKIKSRKLNARIIEIDRHVTDTLRWKRSVRSDSLPWQRMWHPINSHTLPLAQGEAFIVADSTGLIIYNGTNSTEALSTSKL